MILLIKHVHFDWEVQYETESHDQLLSLYCLCAKYSLYQLVIIIIHTHGLIIDSMRCHLYTDIFLCALLLIK